MKISVVTPNFNYGRFLSANLESVFSQTLCDESLSVEHIIVDGGSTDESLNIIKDWESSKKADPAATDNRYSFRWVSEKDNGQAEAINKGLCMATGDIVCWLNSDEEYMPGVLSRVQMEFLRRPDLDFVYGEPMYVDADGKKIRIKHDHPFSGFVLMWYGCYIASCCSFWRRRILDAGEYLDAAYKVVMDGEYYVRLMKLGYKFGFIPLNIAKFTWWNNNISCVFNKKRIEEQTKIRLLYAPMIFSSLRMRRGVLSFMNFVAHMCRRALVVFRLIFLPR